jgi:hypothetical protein
MRKRNPQTGDMIVVDAPGSVLDKCYGVVLQEMEQADSFSLGDKGHRTHPILCDINYRIILSNPPEDHPRQVMLRGKWLKILSKKK